MKYNSLSDIRNILKINGISLKKRWGQNFLINPDVRKKIIELVGPEKNNRIWEIGSGLGALTSPLLASGAHVFAFEIDWGMIRFLKKNFARYPDFTIIQGDVVKTWPQVLKEYGNPDKICGNLPYSSASTIITSFIRNGFSPPLLVFTIQRELALRLTALPGTKSYSSFSILFQFAFAIREKQDIKQGSFYPAPDVVSSVIQATPAQHNILPYDRDLFFHLVKTGFLSRRKILLNNLLSDKAFQKYSPRDLVRAIEETGFNQKVRGEELTVGDFIRLSNILKD